jgi:Tfp pilus assembly protein PilO
MTTPTDPSLIRTGHGLNALGLCAMLVLGIGPYVAAGLPMSAQNAALKRQIEKTTRMLELESHVSERHDKLSREAADHEERRREVLERIPETADEAQFLGQLTELAVRCQLKTGDYRPGPPEKKRAYSQMDIALAAEGSYEQLCRFLSGLETLPRFCRLAGLTVDRTEGDLPSLRIAFTLRIFFNSTPDRPANESAGNTP